MASYGHLKDVFTLIFTDGSVSDGPVGCGAGAALLVPPNPDLDLLSLAEAVGQMVDNVECEIVGIKLATDLALGTISMADL